MDLTTSSAEEVRGARSRLRSEKEVSPNPFASLARSCLTTGHFPNDPRDPSPTGPPHPARGCSVRKCRFHRCGEQTEILSWGDFFLASARGRETAQPRRRA